MTRGVRCPCSAGCAATSGRLGIRPATSVRRRGPAVRASVPAGVAGLCMTFDPSRSPGRALPWTDLTCDLGIWNRTTPPTAPLPPRPDGEGLMPLLPWRPSATPVALAVGAVVAVYAWWATGLPPFTAGASLAVGLPVLALIGVALAVGPRRHGGSGPSNRPTSDPTGLRTAFPWLMILLAALTLEGVGLALGGRSAAVPTLSTVVDHALAWHAVRFALFCGWLAAGWVPALRSVLGSGRSGV